MENAREVMEKLHNEISLIHPKMIAEAIAGDRLKEWCLEKQVGINTLLVQLPVAHEKGEAT